MVSALRWPDGVLEAGLRESLPGGFRHTLSPVRFEGETELWRAPAIFGGMQPVVSLQARLQGGGRSLALTILRLNSLLTGKNTGNLLNLALKNRTPALQIAPSAREAAHHL